MKPLVQAFNRITARQAQRLLDLGALMGLVSLIVVGSL